MDDLARQAIIALAERNGGTLQPEEVVNAARNKTHPLHKLFQWDDAIAAHEHRLATARSLIRRVRVEVVTTELVPARTAPMFTRNPESSGYATLSLLRQNPDLSREAAVMEFQRAAQALRRAQQIAVELGLGVEAVSTVASLVRGVVEAQQGFGKTVGSA